MGMWTTKRLPTADPNGFAQGAQPALALVIPTLCEAQNIRKLLDRVRSALEPTGISFEIVVVDDDSRDGTGAIVSAIARQDPRIRLIVRKGERGLSGAILDGWRSTAAPILGVMDADLQHPPQLLPELVGAILEGRDLAIGSRYTAGGGLGDWNFARKLCSLAAVWATWPVQKGGLRVRDPMSGFFLVRRAAIEHVAFQRTGFKLLLEILVRGRVASVKEIPIAFGRRTGGASKANCKVAWHYARLLARLYAGKCGLHRRHALGAGL